MHTNTRISIIRYGTRTVLVSRARGLGRTFGFAARAAVGSYADLVNSTCTSYSLLSEYGTILVATILVLLDH